MPPALSDEEESDGDVAVSLTTVPNNGANDNEAAPIRGDVQDQEELEQDDEGDQDDMSEDEFVVEKITSHVFTKGHLKFKVKWEGYDKAEDQTWEEEDNLKENASSVLEEYLGQVGGRDRIIEESSKGKKRGRPVSTNTPTNGAKRSKKGTHPASATPPASAGKSWTPPAGSWEEQVASIDACHDENTGKLVVYLSWKNGQKTQHDTKIVYSRCPQKMLQFYEQHVKIVKSSADVA